MEIELFIYQYLGVYNIKTHKKFSVHILTYTSKNDQGNHLNQGKFVSFPTKC